jgi:hypothetical protein
MTTNSEYHIVYELINAVRNSVHNNDEVISERLMRQILKTYRADSIRRQYKNGININDEVIQKISLSFTKSLKGDYVAEIPKIIRLERHAGFFLNKEYYNIPIVDSESFDLSKKNSFAKNLLQGKTVNQNLIIQVPKKSNCLNKSGELYSILSILEKEQSFLKKIDLDFSGIFADPSEDPNYNWEESIYPFPSERLVELKSQIAFKEFQLTTQYKKDEIQNARQDNVIYQNEFNIEE